MDPVSAAITAGVGLLGNLFGGLSQAAQARKKAAIDTSNQAFEMQGQAEMNKGKATQTGLQSMIDAYKSALQRPQW